MKVRSGFVSNSSSTSFLIYGDCWSNDDLPEDYKGNASNYVEELVERNKIGLDSYYGDPNYGRDDRFVYIGKSPEQCPDDMTMGEWKKQIEEELKRLTNNNSSCCWHEESYYNG